MSKSGTSEPCSADEFLKAAQEKFKNNPPLTNADFNKMADDIMKLGGLGVMVPIKKETNDSQNNPT